MLEKIQSILSIEKKSNNYDWKKIEDMFKIKFPIDYKLFIDNFGEGAINDFLCIFSPFSENKYLNTIFQFNEMKEAYEVIKECMPEMCEFEFWKNGKGLFPWAITANGDELYWNYTGNSVDIVIFGSRYYDKQIFSCSTVEFLVQLLKKEIECRVFPDNIVEEKNYYKL